MNNAPTPTTPQPSQPKPRLPRINRGTFGRRRYLNAEVVPSHAALGCAHASIARGAGFSRAVLDSAYRASVEPIVATDPWGRS